jgi:hypothetical protein
VPSFVHPFVGRTLHKSGGIFGAQVSAHFTCLVDAQRYFDESNGNSIHSKKLAFQIKQNWRCDYLSRLDIPLAGRQRGLSEKNVLDLLVGETSIIGRSMGEQREIQRTRYELWALQIFYRKGYKCLGHRC